MMNTRQLSRKEEKEILNSLREQYGIEIKEKFLWFESGKGRIWILNKNVDLNEFKKLRIEFFGVYVAFKERDGIRLTIEGSQILGKSAKKNLLEISEQEMEKWLRGYELETKENIHGYVIIKNKNDFAGCGKVSNGKVLNMIPKARRIISLRLRK